MMLMFKSSLSFGLLAIAVVALSLAVGPSEASHHPLLSDGNLQRLKDISHLPKETRCNQFVGAIRDVVGVSYHKASGEQLLDHALVVLQRASHTKDLAGKIKKCLLRNTEEYLSHNLDSSELVGALKDKAVRKLGLDHVKEYGDRLGEGIKHEYGHLKHHAYNNIGLPLEEAGHYLKHGGEHLMDKLRHEKRHLERALDSKLLELHARAREIDLLRHELHDLKKVASNKAHEVTARIIDHAHYESLKLGHEIARKREHHLEKVIYELEAELRGCRGHGYGYGVGHGKHGYGHGHGQEYGHGHVGSDHGHSGHAPFYTGLAEHGEGKQIWDPVEQAQILAHNLAHNHHETIASRCYKYYLLFTFPEAVTKKTIKTVAKLQVKVKTMKQFFKLVNPLYLPNLLSVAHRLSESIEESARRIGHEMRSGLVEAEEYVRHHHVHFADDHYDHHLVPSVFEHLGLSSSHGHGYGHVQGHGFDYAGYGHGSGHGHGHGHSHGLGLGLGNVQGHGHGHTDFAHEISHSLNHHHSTPSSSTSTSVSTSAGGAAAAAGAASATATATSAGAGASAGAAASTSTSASSGASMSALPSIESMERHQHHH